MRLLNAMTLATLSLLVLVTAAPGQWGGFKETGGKPQSKVLRPTPRRSPAPATIRFSSHDAEGRVLSARLASARSSRAVLGQVRQALSERLGAQVRLAGAVASRNDDEAQGSFAVRTAAGHFRGLIFCRAAGDGSARVSVVMDRRDRAAQTLGTLVTRLPDAARLAKARPLVPMTLPDGSGSLRAPQGFRLVHGYRGTAELTGPEGQNMAMAIWFPVSSRAAAAQYEQMMRQTGVPEALIRQNRGLAADLVNPVQAFKDVLPQVYAKMSTPIVELKVKESQPFRDARSQSAYILADLTIRTKNGRRQQIRGLFHVVTSVTSPGQWLFYYSFISAPPKIFNRDMSLMLRSWNTFKVSGREIRRRVNQALKSMRESFEIHQAAIRSTQKTYDRVNAAWGHVFRGSWPVEDTEWNERHDPPTLNVKPLVESLNEAEGYERWRVIPMEELLNY